MAEYDEIAEGYTESEESRLERIYIINPSFIKKVGKVKGRTMLDLACGDGNFSRKFKKEGAKEVVGVDISKEMIKLAKEKTLQESLDVKYLVGDVIKLGKIKEFDMVIAAFLLHYAKTKEELIQMCKNIYINLKKGGRFITLNQSPTNPLQDFKEFGAKVEGPKFLKEGDELTVKLYDNLKEICSFKTYHWSKSTYESCLKEAGFKNIKWMSLNILKEGIKKYPKYNWKKYVQNPYILILEARK
ncbi:ubiquinone biosynthesis O-methyltransferase [archaeon BMS3Abin17]|nr:ubiquinone biosynthesis O-methyltransferase [archaeon BMS3Abin17]HDZ60733.1 class I SAM-dependent methyltransferase [Candidatus Pacearchaeota archaeon]